MSAISQPEVNIMQAEYNPLFKQKLLFIHDVEQIIGRNRLTLRRWWTAGKFPQPTKLNGTALAWHNDTVDRWINQNICSENA